MAYEYNPKTSQFEIPNPHRVENWFLAICAVVAFGGAVVALLAGRLAFEGRNDVTFGEGLAVGLALLVTAVFYALALIRQVRFFFGRGQPADLVPHLDPDQDGYKAFASPGQHQLSDARALRETMRQNAITYTVPRAPIDNLLYSLVRDLVYSPRVTQNLVRSQFGNLLGLVFLLLCLSVSLVGIRNEAAVAWIGLFYFCLAIALVLRPIASGSWSSARLPPAWIIVFIAGSLVGPVVVATLVPSRDYPLENIIPLLPVTFVILGSAIISSALLMMAGISNTVRPDNIAAAPFLETPSVNATPAQMFTELAREMQSLWVEQIPNRTYMRILPDTSARQGAFDAHLLEETQPLAQDLEPLSFSRALALPTTRWLMAVDAVSTLLNAGGVGLLVAGALNRSAVSDLIYGASLLIVAAFGARSANGFWRRFEFKSRLYWIECNGNYSRAASKIGALLQDRVHTERELVNVETMTLRVWVAELDSVAFDTDSARDMVSLRGLPLEAERLCRHLATFGMNQGTVIVPSSPVDQQRLGLLQGLNGIAQPGAIQGAAVAAALGTTATEMAAQPRFCGQCGAPVSEDSTFCSKCGERLKPDDGTSAASRT